MSLKIFKWGMTHQNGVLERPVRQDRLKQSKKAKTKEEATAIIQTGYNRNLN